MAHMATWRTHGFQGGRAPGREVHDMGKDGSAMYHAYETVYPAPVRSVSCLPAAPGSGHPSAKAVE